MRAVGTIALNTFRESVRNKVLYNILFVALGAIVFSVSLGEWSVFARSQVMQDFGLATMSLTGLLLAVFIGVGMLGREISSKTVYLIIAKPVPRWQFIVGKFSGLLATLFLNYAVLAAFFWAVIAFMGGNPRAALAWAVLLTWIEMAIMIAASMFFSTFASPTLAAIFTLGFYVAGHLNDLVSVELLTRRMPVAVAILKTMYYLFPNLEHFNVRSLVVYEFALPPGYVVWASVYGILYVGLLLLLSIAIFQQRDV